MNPKILKEFLCQGPLTILTFHKHSYKNFNFSNQKPNDFNIQLVRFNFLKKYFFIINKLKPFLLFQMLIFVMKSTLT